MNVLVINGHEYWESSPGKLNLSLMEASISLLEAKKYDCRKTIVDKGYDIEVEIEKFLWADIIIYLTPVYWFDVPSGFKAYIEKVFSGGKTRLFIDDGRSNGGKYGTGGLMQEKKYMLMTTWNAPVEAFNNSYSFLFENKSVDDVFLGFHSAQKFIGIKKIPSLHFHDVKKNPDYNKFIDQLESHLLLNL